MDFMQNIVDHERSTVSPNVRNDAERAAVIASILDFKVRPSALNGLKNRRGLQFSVRKNVASVDLWREIRALKTVAECV